MHAPCCCLRSVREGQIARTLIANTKGGLTGALQSGLRHRRRQQRGAYHQRPAGPGAPGVAADEHGPGRESEQETALAALLSDSEDVGSGSDADTADMNYSGRGQGRSGVDRFSARMAQAIEAVERGSPRGPLLGLRRTSVGGRTHAP